MSGWASFFQKRLVPGEGLVEIVENVKVFLDFVPSGRPRENAAPGWIGSLALTSHRLMVQWTDERLRIYSTLAIYGLSERYFKPGTTWPYQAILILPGGLSLIVETIAKDSASAERLSAFLTKALFTLGKKETDIASVAAMNAYQEELRRQQER